MIVILKKNMHSNYLYVSLYQCIEKTLPITKLSLKKTFLIRYLYTS